MINKIWMEMNKACSALALAVALGLMLGSPVSAQAKGPKEGFGFGVALGGYGVSEIGVSAMYATSLGSGGLTDQIGLEFTGTYSQGTFGEGLASEFDVSYLGFGAYGTYRYGISDQLDLIGMLGGQYINVSSEFDGSSLETGGFFLAGGAAVEYELNRSAAIRGQIVSLGTLDLMYVIRM